MNELIEELLETYSKDQLSLFAPENERKGNIYAPGFGYIPRNVYFYSIRMNEECALEISGYHYFERDDEGRKQRLPYGRLQGIIDTFARIAHGNEASSFRLTDVDIEELEWESRSYVVFFFDEPRWKLHDQNDSTPPVTFTARNTGSRRQWPNHTFFDARDFDVVLPIDGKKRTAIALINYMMRDDVTAETVRHSENQYFKFNLVVDVEYADGSTSPMTVMLDPGGTNQGPPETP